MIKFLKKNRKHLNTILLGLIITWLTAQVSVTKIEAIRKPIDRLEGIIYDVRLNASLPETPRQSDTNIFIVDIDEKALKDVGRWPWSRSTVKQMVENLFDAGVAVVGFDVIFSEPQLNPVVQVAESGALSHLSSEQLALLTNELDADQDFAAILSDYDVVLGALFQSQEDVNVGFLRESPVSLNGLKTRDLMVQDFPGKVSNIDVLQEMTLGQGFINSSPDRDGYIRRANLVIEHNDKLYPSLALEVARLFTFEEVIDLITEVDPESGKIAITEVRFGEKNKIRTDKYGRVLVPYRGGQKSFPYYSAADVLTNNIPIEQLEGGVALVGTSAVGLADLRATSVGLQYPGVEVHANVLEGLLHEGNRAMDEANFKSLFSHRPNGIEDLIILEILLLGIILSITLPFFGPVSMAIIGSLSIATVIGYNLYQWNDQVEAPIVEPLALVVFLTFYNFSRGFFTENANKQRVKSMFDQYVPPAHIDKMIEDPDSFTFEGERKELTVLFSDIRSFTTISEKLSANELKDMLNEYFTPITKSIFEHQGTIDKYIGDLVMAIWGAPVDVDNHAEAAVIGGFDMLAITARLREEFVAKDWPAIRVGIGVNTGEMNVGDMGSVYRRSYTVLGDAVNLGSRLEGLTKFYGVEFLVSEFTKDQCPNIAFRPADKVKVKGKDVAVAIFEPVCKNDDLTAELNKEIEALNQAYNAYLSQSWDNAEARYQSLQQQYPDRYLYQLYLERIDLLRQEPPGDNWDGSFTHTSK